MLWHEQRAHTDARRRGFYDIIPRLSGEMNFTDMNAGAISGLHCHRIHTDYLTVAKGSILVRLVYEDGRAEEKFVFKEQSRRTLIIPPGVWHGYRAIEPSILVFYIDRKYDPADELKRETRPEEWKI